MNTYYTIVTNSGKQQFATATQTTAKVNITHLALGDGNGNTPTPSATRTALVKETVRVAVNKVETHATNRNWIEIHAIIPSSSGGYTVRELALYAGTTMIANGNFPATYKPTATEGGAREMSIKLIIAVEDASVVNVTLDNSLVYATQKWVEDNFVNHNEVINTLTATDTNKPLSAAQGKVLQDTKANQATAITAGNGLTGGGTLQANRTVTLGTPSQITASSTNTVTATSHTHAIDKASTTTQGIVQLVDNLTTDDATKVLTAKQGKALHDNKLDKTANAVSASKLATARTINGVAFDGTANITITDNTKAPTVHRHNWSEIDGKPSTFTPSSHTHTIANITDYDVRQISTEDLNGITKWGIYGQSANNQSLVERNYPVPNEAGTLEVMPGTYGLRQRFTTFATHRQFERSRNNAMTGWNDWTELSNTWSAIRDKPSNLAYTSSNVASATKLQTARNIAMTGDGSWNVNFDGSANASGTLTLANSGVTAGSYNSVTVDAKGRVTRGLSQVHGLITATTATGTANQATTNTNTYLNIVASGVGSTASVGSSTQVTGTNGITVSSDTAGKLIISRDSNSPTATKLQTARTINGVAFDGTQNITIYDNTKLASNANAVSASRLATARTISLTGAVTGSVSFNGSANVSITTSDDNSVGLIAYFATSSAPTGWLKANGAAVSRTTYAKLFAKIGTTFGAGDGSTTFNLPDLRGEFIRGFDDGRNVDGGRGFGSEQADAIRNIYGEIHLLEMRPSTASGVFKNNPGYNGQTYRNGGRGENSRFVFDASTVVPTAHENRPRNIALLACIKY